MTQFSDFHTGWSIKKLIINAIQTFIGLAFIFSGLIKLNDPMGFSYKLEEYFSENVLNIPFLSDYALLFALFLVTLEVLLGLALLIGYKIKGTLFFLLTLTVFFTFLTFYSAYFEKVADCGCFGDAIPLTPWQSFYKDIALLGLTLLLIQFKNHLFCIRSIRLQKFFLALSLLGCFALGYYVLNHLPVLDFRPYAKGKSIVEQMSIPEDAPKNIYEDQWFYKINGKTHSYSTEEKPWEIEGAEFVDRKTKLIQKGYEPPILELKIENDEGDNALDSLLTISKSIWVVVKKLESANPNGIKEVKKELDFWEEKKYKIFFLTSSAPNEIERFKSKNAIYKSFYCVDETVLKTMVRSNTGILVLHKDRIIDKKHWNDVSKLKLYSSIQYEIEDSGRAHRDIAMSQP